MHISPSLLGRHEGESECERECVHVRKSVLEKERVRAHVRARERVEPMLDKV